MVKIPGIGEFVLKSSFVDSMAHKVQKHGKFLSAIRNSCESQF